MAGVQHLRRKEGDVSVACRGGMGPDSEGLIAGRSCLHLLLSARTTLEGFKQGNGLCDLT